MNSWLEFSRELPIMIFAGLCLFVVAIWLYDGLRSLIRGIRSRFMEKTPEEEAIEAIVQGAFQLDKPGTLRQRFTRRYEVAVKSHWGAGGRWRSLP